MKARLMYQNIKRKTQPAGRSIQELAKNQPKTISEVTGIEEKTFYKTETEGKLARSGQYRKKRF